VKKPNIKKVEDSSGYFIKKEVSDEQIDSDNEIKFYLNNSISKEIKQSLNFWHPNCIPDLQNYRGINVKGKEERIIEIKDQLRNITYDPENDINLFNPNYMLFDELEDLDHRLTKEKFNYLYIAISMQISMEIGLMSFKGKWEDASQYLNTMVPELKYLKELKELKAKRFVNKSKEIKNSVTLSNKNNRKRNNRQIKCYICN